MRNLQNLLNEGVIESEKDKQFLETLDEKSLDLVVDLMLDDVMFVGNNNGTKALFVLVSDTFCYACADAEYVSIDELPEIDQIFHRFGYLGIVCWVSSKRNEKPVTEIYNNARYAGIWEEMYGDSQVNDNACNKVVAHW